MTPPPPPPPAPPRLYALRVRSAATGKAQVLRDVPVPGDNNDKDEDARLLAALRSRIEHLFGVPAASQTLRAGVPPRVVTSLANDVANMDTVLVEDSTRPTTTTSNKRPRKRKRSAARTEQEHDRERSVLADVGERLAESAQNPRERELRPFRRSLHEALLEHEQQIRAEDRYRAALASTYVIVGADERAGGAVTYPKHNARTARHEDAPFQPLPDALLRAVVAQVAQMPPEHRQNLRPSRMACVSPRVFWSVVRYAAASARGSMSLERALVELAPAGADLSWLLARCARRRS